MSRFLHLALGLGLLFALPACDSNSSEDPDPEDGGGNGGGDPAGFLCSVPTGSVAAGSFSVQVEQEGAFETRTGTAEYGLVDYEGGTYFVVQLTPPDGDVVSLYESRSDVPATGTYEFSAFGPITAFVDYDSGTFGGPGSLEVIASSADAFAGTFEFGLLRDPGDTDTASACGAFNAERNDDIDPDDIAGLF